MLHVYVCNTRSISIFHLHRSRRIRIHASCVAIGDRKRTTTVRLLRGDAYCIYTDNTVSRVIVIVIVLLLSKFLLFYEHHCNNNIIERVARHDAVDLRCV
jgi:hypothetical protein